MAAMGKRIIVSGGDEVRRVCAAGARSLRTYSAGRRGHAVRMRGNMCFAQVTGAIWFGGWTRKSLCRPGFLQAGRICANMLISPDGERLMILCAEADSVLLLDAVCGAPMVLARAGVNPQHMSLDESGEVLAVAAGESGEVLLLSARSLALLRRLPMPGIVLDVALRAGTVYALCLNETLNSTLVTIPRAGGVGRFFRFRACRGGLPVNAET